MKTFYIVRTVVYLIAAIILFFCFVPPEIFSWY